MNEFIKFHQSQEMIQEFFFFNSNALFVIFVFRFEEIFSKAFLSKIRHQIWRYTVFYSS